MLRRDLLIRMQALLGIAGPDLDRLIQKGEQIRRRRLGRHTGRQLLAVFRPAVCQHLAHHPGRPPPDIAVMVHQQLI